jgi:hypothetical protein
MRYVTSAILLTLLGFSAANATVYVWQDPHGVLVLTNDAHDVPKDAGDSVTSYTTAGGAQDGQQGAAPGKPSAMAPPTGPAGPATRPAAASTRQASVAAATRTLGQTATATQDARRTAAASQHTRMPDPRAELLQRYATRREPPVIVSVVPSSARPLSTSTQGSLASGGGSGSSFGSSGSTGNRLGGDMTGGSSMGNAGMLSSQGMAGMR